jgi:type II secretory pathway pseudopilin PulG
MIKLFRKIRQNLLMENKTGRYFKYAIGEIVLVVIGILIALQINNWNENRKANVQEQKYYQLLLEEIKQDKEQIVELKASNQNRIKSINEALREIQKEKPRSLTFGQKWLESNRQYNNKFRPNNAAYSDIKSSGKLNIIKDKTITKSLNTYYTNISNYTELIFTNTNLLNIHFNTIDSWFDTGVYQAYLSNPARNYIFAEDVKTQLLTDLPEHISELNKQNLYDMVLTFSLIIARRAELLVLIENEVDIMKDILEKKCSTHD